MDRKLWSITLRFFWISFLFGIFVIAADPFIMLLAGFSPGSAHVLSAGLFLVESWYIVKLTLCNDYKGFRITFDAGKMTAKHFLAYLALSYAIGIAAAIPAFLLLTYVSTATMILFLVIAVPFAVYLSFQVFFRLFRKSVHIVMQEAAPADI